MVGGAGEVVGEGPAEAGVVHLGDHLAGGTDREEDGIADLAAHTTMDFFDHHNL